MRGRQWTREPPEKYEWGVAVVSKRRAVHGGGREGREGKEGKQGKEGRKEGRVKRSNTRWCETSVRREKRYCEATNLARDAFSVSVPSREGKVVDVRAPRN